LDISCVPLQFINKTQSAGKATPLKPANKTGLVAERMLGVSKQIAAHLMNGLFHENSEVLLESVRVLGKDPRRILCCFPPRAFLLLPCTCMNDSVSLGACWR
jgi:hypothetical protein